MMRTGAILSHASTVAGPIVTECEDPYRFKQVVEAAQPGCEVTPVWDAGDGWCTADGRTPDQVIAAYMEPKEANP